jgi:hypothetical protein
VIISVDVLVVSSKITLLYSIHQFEIKREMDLTKIIPKDKPRSVKSMFSIRDLLHCEDEEGQLKEGK